MNKAAFLDRDGVINRKLPEGQYVTRWEEFQFLPRVADAVAALKSSGFHVFVVSNQRGVAKGLLSLGDLALIHKEMLTELAAANAVIDEVYFCPHEEDPPCNCRKPRPGLLLLAAQDHEIDLVNSWMIGDSESDVQAGKNAGCRTARILNSGEEATGTPDLFARSLFEAVQEILGARSQAKPAELWCKR